jgi:hypothetical protein
VLVLIMTLHSFGEGYVLGLASGRPVCIANSGSAPLCLCCACAVLVLCCSSGVGISFSGVSGFEQGLLVTVAIGLHNIPEGLAVARAAGLPAVPCPARRWFVSLSRPRRCVALRCVA